MQNQPEPTPVAAIAQIVAEQFASQLHHATQSQLAIITDNARALITSIEASLQAARSERETAKRDFDLQGFHFLRGQVQAFQLAIDYADEYLSCLLQPEVKP